jgi:NADP-dependent 3-hydroxy acid dehydrogenase YdfG
VVWVRAFRSASVAWPANHTREELMSYQALANRIAVVTGAASGIGASTARLLAAHGARVALMARREDRLAELAGQITAAGGQAMAVPTDVTSDDSVTGAAEAVRTSTSAR